MSNTHEAWHMRRALRLAEQGKGWTLPNPMVGAILVKEDRRIGEGFHTQYGAPHAEIEALHRASESPEGATLYVTLEPCCHQGKTPPCTEALIKAGLSKVVIATLDPSEKVKGKGVQALQEAGIEVEVGLLEKEAREQNRFFFTFHEKKRPYITLKAALSLDGKIAEAPGKETPLTGLPAKRYVHALRHEHQAILVGAGTVLTDDPHLGVRLVSGRDPLRIVLKGTRNLPPTAQVFRDKNILVFEQLSIKQLLKELYDREITSVLVEGGKHVFESFLEAGLGDELQLLVSPRFLGEKAVPFAQIPEGFNLENAHWKTLGKDLLLRTLPK